MNEQIRELAEQAGIKEELVVMFKGDKRAYVLSKDDVEKFAELIVWECVKNIDSNKKCDIYTGELTDCDWNDVIQYQIDSLKEHFGVEE